MIKLSDIKPIDDAARDGNEHLLLWGYVYPGDKHPTVGFTVGVWEGGQWETVCEEAGPENIRGYVPLPDLFGIEKFINCE